jgi:predicted GNAT family acetyltransferase
MGEYAIMDAAFKLAHSGPKYLSSAAKNLLSSVPKEVLEVAAEKYPDGKQTLEDVAKFTETKAKVQDFVPEEKVAAVTGLTEKVQNLENNIKELEERKKTSSQALHPFMDGWIKEYQDEIDFYKKQVDKVVKSKDPTGVVEEIDDVTGLKAGQVPEVVEGKVEDITQFPETLKAKNKLKEFNRKDIVNDDVINLKYDDNGKEVGGVTLGKFKNYLTLNHIYFSPEYRGTGLSKFAYKDALDMAKQQGYEGLMVGGQLTTEYKTKETYKNFKSQELDIKNEKGEPYILLTDWIGKPTEVDLTTAKKMNASQNRYGIIKDGAEAGFIVATNPENNVVKIKGVTVNEELRGKNIAGDAYVKLGESLAKEGISLESDSFDKMEPSATRVWEKLSDKGLAVKGENSYQFKPTEVKETIKTTENAIQEPSPEGVLQPEQERVRETGGERKRVEPSVKGKEIAKEGKQAKIDEKKLEEKGLSMKGLRAAETRKINEEAKKIVPETALQMAKSWLSGKGNEVSWDAIREVAGTKKKAQLNIGKAIKSEEIAKRDYAAKEEGKGMNIDEITHNIWDNLTEEQQSRIPESDVKEAVMQAIRDINTKKEAVEDLVKGVSKSEEELYWERIAAENEEIFNQELKDINDWLAEKGEKEYENEFTDEYINNLIEQYEAESKAEAQRIAEGGKGEGIEEVSRRAGGEKAKATEAELAKDYKEVISKASKKAKENAKKDFVDRNFDSIVAKLKIQIKCPT